MSDGAQNRRSMCQSQHIAPRKAAGQSRFPRGPLLSVRRARAREGRTTAPSPPPTDGPDQEYPAMRSPHPHRHSDATRPTPANHPRIFLIALPSVSDTDIPSSPSCQFRALSSGNLSPYIRTILRTFFPARMGCSTIPVSI
ncbi:hypothetical protein SGPA1_70002 [Streptomyces misionensis JCM 4497]